MNVSPQDSTETFLVTWTQENQVWSKSIVFVVVFEGEGTQSRALTDALLGIESNLLSLFFQTSMAHFHCCR